MRIALHRTQRRLAEHLAQRPALWLTAAIIAGAILHKPLIATASAACMAGAYALLGIGWLCHAIVQGAVWVVVVLLVAAGLL